MAATVGRALRYMASVAKRVVRRWVVGRIVRAEVVDTVEEAVVGSFVAGRLGCPGRMAVSRYIVGFAFYYILFK